MQIVDIHNSITCRISEQMVRVSDELSSGRAADHAEYKRMVGMLQGMRKALDSVDMVFNKMLDEHDD